MYKRGMAAVLTIVTAATAVFPITAEASSDFDMRKKVIGIAGIMNVTNVSEQVTRGEFAYMLVNATTYKSTVSQMSNVAVFADVPRDHRYAAQIRIAAEQGWMNGYLGGLFKPDSYITMQEAAKGLLALLGYTNEDFTGDQLNSRLSKFYYLEMNENVERNSNEILNKSDCINLFYNLLKTDTKNGTFYGKVLDLELNSDGEINPLALADNNLKGPKLVRRSYDLEDWVPFSLSEANLFLNGAGSSIAEIKSKMSEYGYVVIYYSTATKSVWAYSEDNEDASHTVVRGEVTDIYYNAADVMTPNSITLDTYGDDEKFNLESSQVQFAFSMYGTVGIGDDVALICETTEKSDGTKIYTVIDYIEY